MKDIKYIAIIDGSRVEIEKKHRTKSQYEYYLTIFMGDSDYESIVMYQNIHLTKRSAINEATRAIKSKPVIIKVI
ncbi:hypothetical protein DRO61_04315 [Candidatus Bathyarchaeota archaeon]|jgi:hypothetical protein|nr:MAG: hypothetical protein DRO61_04315 [Candidatus Bathyarchaeota archaeon]